MATTTNPEEAPTAAPAPAATAAAPTTAPAPKRLNGFAVAGISVGSVILTLALIGGGVAIGANLPHGGRPGIGQQQNQQIGDAPNGAPGHPGNGPARPGDGPRQDGPPAGGPNGEPGHESTDAPTDEPTEEPTE